jgi:hypothetical protein
MSRSCRRGEMSEHTARRAPTDNGPRTTDQRSALRLTPCALREGGPPPGAFDLICHSDVVKWGVGNRSRKRRSSRGRH